jgi:hypothetical protein
MANAAVAAWKACIKEMQGYVANTAAAPDMPHVVQSFDKLAGDADAPLPNAAWKKLVHDAQVVSGTLQQASNHL